MSNKINKFSVLFVKRNAAKRGPTSSESWNDTIEELAHDLTELSAQWNDRLVSLLATIPNGSEGNSVNAIDAWTDGLDGSTLFVDALASSTSNTNYFNDPANRPNTILEQIEDLYSEITALEESISEQIAQTLPTAQQISVADNGGLYLAVNVETALAEVMAKADLALSAGFDLSAVDQHILPSLDDVYDLGSSSLRWKDLYLGPSSLNIISKVTDAGYTVAKDWHFGIASGSSGRFQLKDGATVVAEFDTTSGIISPIMGDLATREYVNTAIGQLDWKENILDQQTAPPGSSSIGDRYIVSPIGTGSWATHNNEIAEWNGVTWDFSVPNTGAVVLDISDGKLYQFDTTWTAWNSKISHANLLNLTIDDHTIYALLTGRTGGQTLIGGTLASNSLTLQSTSHATRGSIILPDPLSLTDQTVSASTSGRFQRNGTDLSFHDGTTARNVIFDTATQALSGKTLTTPTIVATGFTNMNHTHQAANTGGTLDHGLALTGLTDDDHTQYALLLGRSGGQTLIGGTASGNTLTLQSTSNVTKGKILFGTSAYDEVNNRLGIGTTTPLNKTDISGSLAIGSTYAGATSAPTNGLIVEGKTGIGYSSPTEFLEVSGAIRVGGTAVGSVDGTIRWTGTDLEGRKGGVWTSLTAGGATAPGTTQQIIYNDSGSLAADSDLLFNEPIKTLFLASGLTDGSILVGDVNFGLDFFSSTQVRHPMDATDYLEYDRTSNRFNFTIANTLAAFVTSGLTPLSVEGSVALKEIANPGAVAGYGKFYVDTAKELHFYDSAARDTLVTVSGLLAVKVAVGLLPGGTSQIIDLSLGEVQTLDLENATGNVTLTLTNSIIGKTYIVKVIQDSSTPRNLIWPATVKWQFGSTPTITTSGDAIDIVTLLWDGTNYYANIGQDYR